MEYKGLPVYNIILDDTDNEFEGLSVVSIVDQPAVCEQLYCFSKEEKKSFMFADEKNEKHCITSVALLADSPIYRYCPDFGEYYVVFEKQTIRDLVEKYYKDGHNNLVSFQHNGEIVNDFIMLESYFVDKENGLAPSQFDVPDGSWIVTYKCTNDDTWERVKNELATGGYSVEINCSIEPAKDEQIIFDEPEDDSELDDEEFNTFFNKLMDDLENLEDDIELNFEVERTDVARVIDRKESVMIDGKEYWIHSLGKDDDKDVAILYDPKNKKWEIININQIKSWEPTKNKIGTFPEVPNEITDNDDVTIQRTVNTLSYSDLIHNRIPVMISYDDEKPKPHLGYRQCAIIAYGFTKRGNECLRVMETFGASRSASDGTNYIPNYRLMLTRRCKAFKPMFGTQPWSRDILDSRCHYGGDDSMTPCIDAILESDFD